MTEPTATGPRSAWCSMCDCWTDHRTEKHLSETANDPSDGEHVWLAPGEHPNTSRWTCCLLCGVVQRADGRPQKPCRGRHKVTLRSDADA